MRRSRPLILGLLVLSCAAAGPAAAERYRIVPERSEVAFESKAPMESFEGRTRSVSGWFAVDPVDLVGPLELVVEIDLASFDTGIAKRDQHMRDNHLETGRFPRARFTGDRVLSAVPAALSSGGESEVVLRGELDLHGVLRERAITLRLTRAGDGSLRVTGGFPVLLGDHGIERPRFLVLKLADEQTVRLDLYATPDDGGEQP